MRYKFAVIISLLVVACFSCQMEDPYAIPKRMNMGYLFDSLEYEQERWLDCDGNHDTTPTCIIRPPKTEIMYILSDPFDSTKIADGYDTIYYDPHRMYCTMFGFIPYKKLKYAGTEIEDVIQKEGNPNGIWIDTLHYGYRRDNRGEWIFPFEEFFDSEGAGLDSCQSVYRILFLLNHPTCLVQSSVWENDKRFLILRSLVYDGRNRVFWGYQGPSGFYWPE